MLYGVTSRTGKDVSKRHQQYVRSVLGSAHAVAGPVKSNKAKVGAGAVVVSDNANDDGVGVPAKIVRVRSKKTTNHSQEEEKREYYMNEAGAC